MARTHLNDKRSEDHIQTRKEAETAFERFKTAVAFIATVPKRAFDDERESVQPKTTRRKRRKKHGL